MSVDRGKVLSKGGDHELDAFPIDVCGATLAARAGDELLKLELRGSFVNLV